MKPHGEKLFFSAKALPNGAGSIKNFAKSVLRRVVPSAVYARMQVTWRSRRTVIEWVGKVIEWVEIFVLVTRVGIPRIVLYFSGGLGDQLLCSAVLRELRLRGNSHVWIISDRVDLFEGMPDASHVVTLSQYRKMPAFIRPTYIPLEYNTHQPEIDRSIQPSRHIISELCARAGIAGKISLRTYLNLSCREKEEGTWAAGWIAIQSSGLAANSAMKNKEWFSHRFQEVIDTLCDEFKFVQLGSKIDPPLRNAKDMRGIARRQSASVLFNARLYLGPVGFVMHLARAVDCPSVIVYGGREAPWQSGYSCNENLYSPLPCAPCWRWNTCEFERKCMDQISVADVVQSVRKLLRSPRDRLSVQITEV